MAGAHDLFHAAGADAPSEGEWARGIQQAAAVLVGSLGIGVQVAEHDAAMRFRDARNYGHTGVDGSEEGSRRTWRALWAALCGGRVTLVPREPRRGAALPHRRRPAAARRWPRPDRA
jgi:hypothetical protein